MLYPRLTNVLQAYASAVQDCLKRNVQVRTGNLQRSITVRAIIDDHHYSLTIDLLHYWKFLPEPVPFDTIFHSAGLTPPPVSTSFPQDLQSRYPFDFSLWSRRLDEAFTSDLMSVFNSF